MGWRRWRGATFRRGQRWDPPWPQAAPPPPEGLPARWQRQAGVSPPAAWRRRGRFFPTPPAAPPAGGRTPPWVRDRTSYASTIAEASSVVPLPSGWQPGDYHHIVCELTASNGTIDTPAGYDVLVAPFHAESSTSATSAWYRSTNPLEVGASGPTITHTSGRFAAASAAVAGVDPASPEDVAAAWDDGPLTPTDASVVAPSLTPANAGTLYLGGFAVRNGTNGQSTTFSPPGGMTEEVDVSTAVAAVSNAAVEFCSLAVTTTDPTGTKTATASSTTINPMGMAVLARGVLVEAATTPPERPRRRPGRWPTAWPWRVGRGRRWEPPPTAAVPEAPVWVPTTVGSRATRPTLPRRGVWFEAPPAATGPPAGFQQVRVAWRGVVRRGRWWTPPPVEPPPAPSPWTPHLVGTRAPWRPPGRRGRRFEPPWPFVASAPPELPARWLRSPSLPLRPAARRGRRFDPPRPAAAAAPPELPATWQRQTGRPLRPGVRRGRRFDPPWPAGAPAAPELPAGFRRQRRAWVCPNRRSGWFEPPWPTTQPPPPRVGARRRLPTLHRRGRWHEPPWIPGAVNPGVWQPGPVRHAGPRPRLLPPPRRGRRFEPPWPDTAGQFIGTPPRWVESSGGSSGLVESGGGSSGLVESSAGGAGIVEGSGGV